MDIQVARVYRPITTQGTKVLVDRLWPRGVSKAALADVRWLKEAAPSSELRRLYHAGELPFEAFADAYRTELSNPEVQQHLIWLRNQAQSGSLVLLTAVKDIEHSHVPVLIDAINSTSLPA